MKAYRIILMIFILGEGAFATYMLWKTLPLLYHYQQFSIIRNDQLELMALFGLMSCTVVFFIPSAIFQLLANSRTNMSSSEEGLLDDLTEKSNHKIWKSHLALFICLKSYAIAMLGISFILVRKFISSFNNTSSDQMMIIAPLICLIIFVGIATLIQKRTVKSTS